MTEIIRQSPVKDAARNLLVSTVKIRRNYYDTVVFDEHPDKRHQGKVLPGHEHEGRTFGPYVIGASSERAMTREEAMEQHREALYAARTEQIT
ncbi:hypothetical protein OG552_10730 [Streptomyces sp. NBC_01476]|uniref:hypothetical protein n=1 Tax=Streptomyces sp. NBC_01476 TaxID=2903881 RepID=UPI002E2F9C20|nr:hypothetical protein [Streptomyces sp. NBC_01476]